MASISAHLLSTELSFWTELYEDHEGEMQSFARYMNKKYMFKDKELVKIDTPELAKKHIMEHHVKTV